MEIKPILLHLKKWMLRLALSFMLGFSNALNKETKTLDDTIFKIEQVEQNEHD
ncbi:hypothetical protein LZD49_28985 [Dyadobacter sp. CY261]|uniref:hypothetical protein n=1 Tax=Dyadobacter sp. CY261 TaxID=2907203 RepID=UPI001F1EE19D|nr:hypothetical protein [Dyadobacter sp. CY261]MCF0074555.1 hypothetical protein [Dyadobacter sp. CY261]